MPSSAIKDLLILKQNQLKENRNDMKEILNEYSSENYLEICKLNVRDLHDEIKRGNLSKLQVLLAFQQRCTEIEHQNFLCEYLIEANEAAEAEDSSIDQDPYEDNPIYGIPISIKECINVAGKDSTHGLVKYCLNSSLEDAVVVKVLRHLKALPFITTSMAQSGLSVNSSNFIFGKQENPRFPGYVAGGSSGGEGLVVSLNGSPIGLGSDIAGSIRLPSVFNEICGLKPTNLRISSKGMPGKRKPLPLLLRAVIGPMGRCVTDLKDLMEAVLCPYHFNLDPTVFPKVFDKDVYEGKSQEKLNIGYFDCFNDENLIKVTPSVKRGIKIAVKVLQQRGHNLVPFEFPKPFKAFIMALSALLHDGGKGLIKQMEGEYIDASMKNTLMLSKLPRFVKKKFAFIPKSRYGHHVAVVLETAGGLDSSSEASTLLQHISDYRTEFLSTMENLDALICPLYPIPIPRVDTIDLYNNVAICYSIVYNLLDLPAGAICVGRSSKEDIDQSQEMAKQFIENKNIADALFHKNQTDIGMPLCAQIVAKPFKEELVLRVMKIIEEDCKFERTLPM